MPQPEVVDPSLASPGRNQLTYPFEMYFSDSYGDPEPQFVRKRTRLFGTGHLSDLIPRSPLVATTTYRG